MFTAAETIPGGHKLGDWIEGEEATCIKEGVAGHYTCSVCKKNFDENNNELASIVIPKDMKRHVGKLAVENAAAPTCTEAGYTGDSVCTACGNVKVPGTAIPASGHAWDNGTVTKEATCTEAGEKTYACANCDAVRTEQIPALGHTAPDADGKCTRCGAAVAQLCKLCGKNHTGFFGKIVGFFHSIIYFFKKQYKK